MKPLSPRLKKWLLLAVPVILALAVFVRYEFEHTSTNQYCGYTCHIMRPAYESSFHNVHREEMNVNCRDCHLPEENLAETLVYKAYSGARDYYKNTFDPPDVLRTTDWSRDIIQSNCIRCHQTVVEHINISGGKLCFECHRGIPHGQWYQPFRSEKIYTPIR